MPFIQILDLFDFIPNHLTNLKEEFFAYEPMHVILQKLIQLNLSQNESFFNSVYEAVLKLIKELIEGGELPTSQVF